MVINKAGGWVDVQGSDWIGARSGSACGRHACVLLRFSGSSTLASLDISEPRPEEYPAIVELCNQPDVPGSDDPLTIQILLQLCQKQRGVSLVARSSEGIVGVLLCGRVDARNHVERLAIAPSHLGQDIEHALLNKVLVKLGSRGAHTFQFTSNTPGSDMMRWDNAKWQGQCDLQGEIPVGRPQSCAI